MTMMLRRMGRDDITVHGFRSTFRDWAAEQTHHQNHVVEMALAHTIGDKVEAAYRRGELLAKRRELMDRLGQLLHQLKRKGGRLHRTGSRCQGGLAPFAGKLAMKRKPGARTKSGGVSGAGRAAARQRAFAPPGVEVRVLLHQVLEHGDIVGRDPWPDDHPAIG